ncbi:hypothetical protein EH30_08190 [Erythrobacter sp. JL475]|nr:hypothetical protein EH30_08190 [Erythrobacter sp. JL475]
MTDDYNGLPDFAVCDVLFCNPNIEFETLLIASADIGPGWISVKRRSLVTETAADPNDGVGFFYFGLKFAELVSQDWPTFNH